MKANFHPDTYARINDWMKQENLAALTKTTFQKPSIQCEQILDVGCGTGEFTRDRLLPSHHSCSKIVAVDVLSAMVDHARRNHGHSRISYEVLDITTPDVSVFLDEHGKFDRIYSFLCLQWTRDQEAAFRNIGRLLKEDGECLLFFSAPFYLFDVWLEMAGMERWKGILGDLKDIFPDIWHRDPSPSLSDLENSLRRLIADAGMTTLTCEVYSTEAYYPTLEVLLAVLLPIVLVKSGTSEKETSSMRSELSSRLMKRFKMTPRGCSVPVDLFLFHTKKVVREGPTDV
ncbi:juvenile hormone acid O-methyltransferase isoform X2 [Ixodes scapularis]|uniref:juvenile hormone acid O-methyltransferase isoform X2 n=1 Tax=Ixodes scapularis TaxID=6945 RepID=UPI001A9EE463|nr:juvenile hormone acid O-methyltransferase isoform X2 [Ixodes scapularis]